ncbi:MAG: hypothetical protein V1489_02295 [Candidatus Liptonbacteria bacterium]
MKTLLARIGMAAILILSWFGTSCKPTATPSRPLGDMKIGFFKVEGDIGADVASALEYELKVQGADVVAKPNTPSIDLPGANTAIEVSCRWSHSAQTRELQLLSATLGVNSSLSGIGKKRMFIENADILEPYAARSKNELPSVRLANTAAHRLVLQLVKATGRSPRPVPSSS